MVDERVCDFIVDCKNEANGKDEANCPTHISFEVNCFFCLVV